MKKLVTLMMLVAMVALVASSAQATTVGYWRFEDTPGFFRDSSTYGNHLNTTSETPYVLPATGRGSDFDDPIPQTNTDNDQSSDLAGDYFTSPDQAEYHVSDFTIEAYINKTDSDNRNIVAQYVDAATGSWALGVDSGKLFSWLAGTTTAADWHRSNIAITAGKDYFVAMSFDESSKTGGVKFYVLDLAADTWQTATVNHNITDLKNTTNDLYIGTHDGSGRMWKGLIDEVRFSNEILSQDKLLASVPEPATMTLLLLGLPFALRRRRK